MSTRLDRAIASLWALGFFLLPVLSWGDAPRVAVIIFGDAIYKSAPGANEDVIYLPKDATEIPDGQKGKLASASSAKIIGLPKNLDVLKTIAKANPQVKNFVSENRTFTSTEVQNGNLSRSYTRTVSDGERLQQKREALTNAGVILQSIPTGVKGAYNMGKTVSTAAGKGGTPAPKPMIGLQPRPPTNTSTFGKTSTVSGSAKPTGLSKMGPDGKFIPLSLDEVKRFKSVKFKSPETVPFGGVNPPKKYDPISRFQNAVKAKATAAKAKINEVKLSRANKQLGKAKTNLANAQKAKDNFGFFTPSDEKKIKAFKKVDQRLTQAKARVGQLEKSISKLDPAGQTVKQTPGGNPNSIYARPEASLSQSTLDRDPAGQTVKQTPGGDPNSIYARPDSPLETQKFQTARNLDNPAAPKTQTGTNSIYGELKLGPPTPRYDKITDVVDPANPAKPTRKAPTLQDLQDAARNKSSVQGPDTGTAVFKADAQAGTSKFGTNPAAGGDKPLTFGFQTDSKPLAPQIAVDKPVGLVYDGATADEVTKLRSQLPEGADIVDMRSKVDVPIDGAKKPPSSGVVRDFLHKSPGLRVAGTPDPDFTIKVRAANKLRGHNKIFFDFTNPDAEAKLRPIVNDAFEGRIQPAPEGPLRVSAASDGGTLPKFPTGDVPPPVPADLDLSKPPPVPESPAVDGPPSKTTSTFDSDDFELSRRGKPDIQRPQRPNPKFLDDGTQTFSTSDFKTAGAPDTGTFKPIPAPPEPGGTFSTSEFKPIPAQPETGTLNVEGSTKATGLTSADAAKATKFEKGMACFSAAMAVVSMGMRSYSIDTVKDVRKSLAKDIKRLEGKGGILVEVEKPKANEDKNQEESSSNQGGNESGGSGGGGTPQFAVMATAPSPGSSIDASFASQRPLVFGATAGQESAINAMGGLDGIFKQLSTTPSRLAAEASSKGPKGLIAEYVPEGLSEGLKDELMGVADRTFQNMDTLSSFFKEIGYAAPDPRRELSSSILETYGPKGPRSMESGASSGGGLRHGSSASEFSSLPPLPEVDAADIWHRGTDKNIFQIVSDRLVKVVPRVMVK